MSNFQLHARLQQDCFTVGSFALSQLLMMNDSRYPWFILVPRRPQITEIYQLPETDRLQLLDESCTLAEKLQEIYQSDKLNIAAIGNLVPQLHLHHVARFRSDNAWPDPVWGKLPRLPFAEQQADMQIKRMREALRLCLIEENRSSHKY